MPAILERWTGKADSPVVGRSALSWDQYLKLVTSFSFNGMSYSIGSDSYRPAGDFEQLVHSVHADNNIVSACVVARGLLMKQVRFAWRNTVRRSNDYRQLFGDERLQLLERPDPGTLTRPQWLATDEYHCSYAGASFTIDRGTHLELAAPDLIDVVLMGVDDASTVIRHRAGRKAGYIYYREGRDRPEAAEALGVEEVAHQVPEPHPSKWWTGQSWVISVLDEVVTDKAATKYLQKFFDNAATPNAIVKPHERLSPEQVDQYRDIFNKETSGVGNAFKTMWLGAGSDVEIVGSKLADLDLSSLQGGAETRICARARIPAPIAGVREGLQGSALNSGNYNSARRMLADGWFTPTAQDRCASLETIRPPGAGAELWYDPADVLFLQEDAKDAAEIMSSNATALQALDSAGYDADAAVKAVRDNNLSALIGKHDGNQSVQRLPDPEGTTDGDD